MLVPKKYQKRSRVCHTFIHVNCVQELNVPLTKNRDNFSHTGPFLMSNSGNESYGHAASYAFGFIKKHRKVRAENFLWHVFITRFSEKYFSKHIFSNRKFREKKSIRKIDIFGLKLFSSIFRKLFFNRKCRFFENFFLEILGLQKIFWKSSYEKHDTKSFRL